jgi:hypothetical protein
MIELRPTLDLMDTGESTFVAGESAERLLAILLDFYYKPQPGNVTRAGTQMSSDDAACLLRAVTRVEAELMLFDADQITAASIEPRTAKARRADAFVALALRVTDAAERL